MTPYGGPIQSGMDITITAGSIARNIGGNVFAPGNINVNAPMTMSVQIGQHLGLTTWWRR